jgi:creatinine amidohydrolase/Fe(II)-dependent formamide hydrolase-like protein
MRFVPVLILCLTVAPLAQAPDTVFLEELTWTEVRGKLAAGVTTVIIPTGGTEQNGPHMVLGKHNYLVRHKAGETARRLGDALVAPVMAYVPEGNVEPPSGHMRFPGTITTPPEVFEQVLEYAARSLRQHGFVDIALMGDSGGNQASQAAVTERLNEEWADTPARVHHLTDYYPGPGDDWLISQGEREEDVGSHAGMHDTSTLLFLDPSKIRLDRMEAGTGGTGNGVSGTPARSRAEYGEQILEMQIEAAVGQIRRLRTSSRGQ